jgi:predicted RNA-binding protein YlqC (UPF0109 family)
MPQQELCRVYSLLFRTVCAIAQHPAELRIAVIRTGGGATFNISGDPEDIRKFAGHHGGIARSFGVLISGMGLRAGQRYRLSLQELRKQAGSASV